MPQLLKAPLALALSTSLALPGVAMAAPPPASPAGDPAAMSDEEKMEVAKGLYGEGVAALEAGDAASALQKFESAYNDYAPSLHVFNYNIGQAAYELGDCVKAKTSFQRFLDLVGDHDLRGDATEKILEIERSGCANTTAPAAVTTPTPTTTTPAPTTTTGPSELDNEDAPELTSRRDEREDQIEAEVEERDSKKAGPLLISGAALTAVGGLSLIGGAVSLGLANKKANDLANLASPGATGFPDGNYSDDEVFNLDRNALPANNAATIALFIGGGVFTAVGVSLLIVNAKKKKGKKAGDKNAKADDGKSASVRSRPRLVGLGAGPMRGGAAASAAVRF